MPFESAKKYGYIASVINITLPVAAVITILAAIAAVFYQIVSNPTIESVTLLVGVIIGSSIVMLAAGIIALILFLLSMHKLAKYYNEPKIFKNILYGLVITILGTIITSIVTFIITAIFAATAIPSNPTDFAPESIITIIAQLIATLTITAIVSISITLICVIINAFLWYQAFDKLGEKSGIEKFKTAGLLYLIGAVTQIIGIGAILTWIAWILAAQGYKQLKPQQQPTPNTTNYYTPTTTTDVNNIIYCSYCGTENDINNNYCKRCDKTLQTTTQTNPT